MSIGIFRKFTMIFILALILVGCSEELPTPEEALNQYTSYWENENYEEMYDLLSKTSKEIISKEEFIERYTKIYNEMHVNSLSITSPIRDPEDELDEEETEVILEYEQSMNTIADTLSFNNSVSLIREEDEGEKEWKIEWSPSLILPPLEQGDDVRVRTLQPERGEILDRNGVELAKNGNAIEIGLVPNRMEGLEEYTISELSEAINVSEETIEIALNQSWVRPDTFVPIKTVPYDQMDFVEKLRDISAGVTYLVVPAREYPLGERAAHLVGYITPITAELLEEKKDKGYHSNSMIGRTGLESIYEDQLRGELGAIIEVVDAQGNAKDIIAQKEAVTGETLHLTIDSQIQTTIYEQIIADEDVGTSVALHPVSGEILALVNAPSYNPNEFVLGISQQTWQNYNEDEKQPLLNRFTQAYAPGSTIKAITAAIGLENGWDADEKRKIDGLGWKKDSSWGSYEVRRVKDPNHNVDLTDALVYSDNIYFAQMAVELGSEVITEGFQTFGFEETLPFQYPLTTSKIANDGIRSEVQLADTAYGQAELLVNPLHMSLMYTAFINDGNIPKPTLFMEEEHEIWKEQIISKEHAQLVLSDLIQVIEHPNGTGTNAQITGVQLAGKTGTTEYKTTQGEEGTEFGWFMAMNTDDPELLILMMIEDVENGGSSYVIPKVRNVFQEILN